MTTRNVEGHKDGLMLSMAIESIGGRLGGRRCFLVLRDGVSNRARLYLRNNEHPGLLRHQPARKIPETMGSGGPVPPVSIQEMLVTGTKTYTDRWVKMTTRGVEGHKGGRILLSAIESIGGRLGGRRCSLVLRNGVSDRVRLCSQ